MNRLIKLKPLLLLLVILQLTSCEPHNAAPDSKVDDWIYEQMSTYYLWTDQMKEKSATNTALTPDAYFKSLLVQPGELDRFSWIMEDSEDLTNYLTGKNTTIGIKTIAFYADAAQTKVALSVANTFKNSPAERAGIKRGDLITQVDGKDLTVSNYAAALNPEVVKLTFGEYNAGVITSTSRVVTITKEEVQTDPIQFTKVIEKGNKKIGYFVYMSFLTQFDNQLRQVFADFKAKGVNELIVDLRFNGGGSVATSEILTSLIVKNLNTSQLMSKQIWNTQLTKYITDKYGSGYLNVNFKNEASNLGTLNRVYFLTSASTASASEALINNLKPHMDVVLIGGNTYGKNVGSITISDDKKRWKWGMQPIVLITANSKGESNYGTKDGFTPDFKVSDNVIPYKAFGDENETLLKVALQQITGQVAARVSPNARIAVEKEVKLLQNSYTLDNPRMDIKDMWVDPLPGMKNGL